LSVRRCNWKAALNPLAITFKDGSTPRPTRTPQAYRSRRSPGGRSAPSERVGGLRECLQGRACARHRTGTSRDEARRRGHRTRFVRPGT
jgi:hypothetical protein